MIIPMRSLWMLATLPAAFGARPRQNDVEQAQLLVSEKAKVVTSAFPQSVFRRAAALGGVPSPETQRAIVDTAGLVAFGAAVMAMGPGGMPVLFASSYFSNCHNGYIACPSDETPTKTDFKAAALAFRSNTNGEINAALTRTRTEINAFFGSKVDSDVMDLERKIDKSVEQLSQSGGSSMDSEETYLKDLRCSAAQSVNAQVTEAINMLNEQLNAVLKATGATPQTDMMSKSKDTAVENLRASAERYPNEVCLEVKEECKDLPESEMEKCCRDDCSPASPESPFKPVSLSANMLFGSGSQ